MSETIVLLHAMGASRRMWRAQLDALGTSYEVVAPDLPGHGHAPGPFTMRDATEKVRELLTYASGPVHLVGASLGGAVALQVAFAEPDRVASLLLSGAPVRLPPANLLLQRAATAVLPLGSTAAMSVRVIRPADQRDADALVADIVQAGRATQSRVLRELARYDPLSRLPEIKAPTLVCCGSQDKANLPSARLLAAHIDGAELRVIPDAGHLWTLQRPDLCTETVTRFVGSVT